jgi:hypothetical protein
MYSHISLLIDTTTFPPRLFVYYTTPQYKTVHVTAFGSDEDIAKWIGMGVNMTILPAI